MPDFEENTTAPENVTYYTTLEIAVMVAKNTVGGLGDDN